MANDLPPFDPVTLFRRTAEDARRLLPAEQARMEKLRLELAEVGNNIARLIQLASLDGNEPPQQQVQTIDPVKLGEALMKQMPPGVLNTRDLIVQVLMMHKDSDGLKVNEIQAALKAIDHNVADSTLYSYLRDGKTEDIFKNENGRWALTDKGLKAALGFDDLV